MTYGWAILVISIVLGALASLGILNPYTFAPKAQPGSCQVYRYAQGSNQFLSLVGTCTDMLPEYVAQFNYQAIVTPNIKDPPSYSISLWVDEPVPLGTWAPVINKGRWSNPTDWYLLTPNRNCGNGQGIIWSIGAYPHIWCEICYNWGNSNWHFITGIYNNATQLEQLYVNGTLVGSTTCTAENITNYPLCIGCGGNGNFYGYISNIQYYNTTLSANEIKALYQEGIGGAPIDLKNLIAWWPLNGNANDYSGDNYNAKAYGIIWYSTWENSYSPP